MNFKDKNVKIFTVQFNFCFATIFERGYVTSVTQAEFIVTIATISYSGT